MIDLIKKYTYCEHIDPKKAAEYVFECVEKFIDNKLHNDIIDLNYLSGTQIWNIPSTIQFKNKIPYSEEWIKDFGRAFYDIKENKLIIRTINKIKWRIHIAQGYNCRLTGYHEKWIGGVNNLCVVIYKYIEKKE